MRIRTIGLAALLAAGMSACDPLYSMDVRQSLVPAPATDCLVNALSSSPHVARVSPGGRDVEEDGYYVSLRDVVWRGVVTSETAADSSRVITFTYLWLRHESPGLQERRRMAAAAVAVVADVRAACAPESPTPPVCVMTDPWIADKPCPTA